MTKMSFSWDEIFKSIGPSMYGYLRGLDNYTRKYAFEEGLEEFVRTKIIDEVENRKIEIMRPDVETIILQLKQLGLILLETNEENKFTGWTLTPRGEAKLTILKTQRRTKPKNKSNG